jgi:hypothetical protein
VCVCVCDVTIVSSSVSFAGFRRQGALVMILEVFLYDPLYKWMLSQNKADQLQVRDLSRWSFLACLLISLCSLFTLRTMMRRVPLFQASSVFLLCSALPF